MTSRAPRGRRIDGILLLDKPRGISSNAALQSVKRLYQARKAGHTGSLDPLASGLLPICLGEATKVSGYLLEADKHYRVRARLGMQTSTGDTEGEPLATAPIPVLDEAAVKAVLAGFLGEQAQIPPMYSALKQQGRRLYELARAGVEVRREPRRIRISRIELLGCGDDSLEFEVYCSKGTYIRSLVEDIARALGSCGHVAELRRLAVEPFGGQRMHTLGELEALSREGLAALDRLLLPADTVLGHWPAVQLDRDSAYYLLRGQAVRVAAAPASGWVRILGPDAALLGMGEMLEDGRVAPRRLLLPDRPADPAGLGNSSC